MADFPSLLAQLVSPHPNEAMALMESFKEQNLVRLSPP
jgi:hypothetical protein